MNPAKANLNESFERVFNKVEENAKPVKDLKHLKEIAAQWVTEKTKYGTAIYNDERYFARIKAQTKHTTFLRDDEIEKSDLELMEKVVEKLNKETDLFKMYVKAGTGSQQYWIEMIFTPEGSKLAEVAEIMMNASYEKPKEEISCRYLAIPEYQDVVEEDDPMELVYIPKKGLSYIFVGGTTYPGDIYKPVCKVLNAKVFDNDGIEIHSAGVEIDISNDKNELLEKKLVVISGLSLHGKTTLSVSDISEIEKENIARNVGIDTSELEIQTKLLHDDYLYFMPNKKGLEVGIYAPNGIFPAMKGEDSDNPISSRPETILFNTNISDNNEPDFDTPYEFTNRYTGEIKETNNQRAAAPIQGSFPIPVVENGVVNNPNEIIFITLTRDPSAPSAIKWQTIEDAVVYSAGLVVAPTDAVVDRADDLYLNYMCTDFDVAPRTEYVKKMIDVFTSLEESGIKVKLFTLNTGKPEKEETMAVRDAIISGKGNWKENKDLGIEYLESCDGFNSPYIPWKEMPEIDWTARWEEMSKKRRDFFKEKNVDLKDIESGLKATI